MQRHHWIMFFVVLFVGYLAGVYKPGFGQMLIGKIQAAA